MIFAYEIKDEGVVVRRCYGYGTEAELPEAIEGYPVTELGAYAFSSHIDRGSLSAGIEEGGIRLWDADAGNVCQRRACLSTPGRDIEGMGIESASFPASLRKIGAYAFYNCNALEEISFHGGQLDLGAGLFTGCHHIKRLNLKLEGDKTSCLREILIEVPEKLTVYMEGSVTAKLVFPEFFEESVENTPARILVTQLHGSGMYYRNCFYARRFNFQAYDACFYTAKAAEDFDTVLDMALGRLMYPEGLTCEHRKAYESWISENLKMSLESAVKRRDIDVLSYLVKGFTPITRDSAELLKAAAALSSSTGFAEGAAFIMDAVLSIRYRDKKECSNHSGHGRFEL